jgi:hypothetical protein
MSLYSALTALAMVSNMLVRRPAFAFIIGVISHFNQHQLTQGIANLYAHCLSHKVHTHAATPGAGSAKYLKRATTSCNALWVTGNQPPGILIT